MKPEIQVWYNTDGSGRDVVYIQGGKVVEAETLDDE